MGRIRLLRCVLCGLVTAAVIWSSSGCLPKAGDEKTELPELPFTAVVEKITAFRFDGTDPVEVTDARAVELFKKCLLEAEVSAPGEDDMRVTREVTLRLGNEWMSEPWSFSYFDLPPGNPSYVRWGDKWYKIPGRFWPMADAVRQFQPGSFDIDPGDLEFLQEYGWEPFFLISKTTVELPPAWVHRPGDFPDVIYWAWNNELSKDIGLDLTPYLGKTVEARLYKTVENLPEIVGPNRSYGRVVVVRSEGKIIGAWLALGRHFCFACSLKGLTLEDVTGKSVDEWLTTLIDPNDPMERRLSAMTPDQILETYYSAIDRKDYATAHACESRSHLLVYIASNMDDRRLYNDGFGEDRGEGLANFISVKLIEVERAEEFERAEIGYGDAQCYQVTVEQHRRVVAGGPDGLFPYFVVMKRETPETGWRIYSIGTGP